MTEITSLQNPRIKAAAKLHTSRARNQQGRFVVFGKREVERAIQAGIAVDECFVCVDMMNDVEGQRILASVPEGKLVSVTGEIINKLEFGDRKEGVVLVANRPNTDLEQVELPEKCLAIVLESIEKPGNLGAILRSCDGAGVDLVILSDPLTDFFHPNCVRSSMGAVFSLRLAKGTTDDVIPFMRSHQFHLLSARVDARQSYRSANYLQDRTAVAFGNEADGLSDRWNSEVGTPIYIPMNGIADSLNVSVSAAVVMYEAVAQRDAVR